MSEVAISYKGSSIATMDASGTKTLLTQGKYCEDDIEVVYTRPAAPAPSLQTKSKTYTPTTSQQTESVSADSGYDGLSAVNVTVNAMPSGTAGTPTATKGTVSNHSVSVTPSVTNTTGYITGSTKTGTAVSVSASELVSGNKAITANGTGIDVANYSTVSVAVETGVHVDVITASSNHWGYADSGRTIYFYGLKGEPTSFAMITSRSFSRNTSQRNYYILDILYDGTSTVGRYFYVYNGSTTHDTSHYSFSYSSSYGGKSNVLVITSSSTSYGTFYSASDAYELVYTY